MVVEKFTVHNFVPLLPDGFAIHDICPSTVTWVIPLLSLRDLLTVKDEPMEWLLKDV